MAVPSLIRASQPPSWKLPIWPLLLAGLGSVGLCLFLLLPGSIAFKAHLALHGICAQRPSHSLHIGGVALPLDARMTGLYIGAVATSVWFLIIGRARSTKLPPRGVLAVLALFVVALGVDGTNALAVDLGLPHPYAPSNALRLATGILAGTALGVAMVYLLATSVWMRTHRTQAVVERPTSLIPPVGIGTAIGAAALSGLPILYAPYALGLLVAAIGVFAALATIVFALVTNHGWSCSSFGDVAALACGGLLAAVMLIGALSWVRLLAESQFGLPELT